MWRGDERGRYECDEPPRGSRPRVATRPRPPQLGTSVGPTRPSERVAARVPPRGLGRLSWPPQLGRLGHPSGKPPACPSRGLGRLSRPPQSGRLGHPEREAARVPSRGLGPPRGWLPVCRREASAPREGSRPCAVARPRPPQSDPLSRADSVGQGRPRLGEEGANLLLDASGAAADRAQLPVRARDVVRGPRGRAIRLEVRQLRIQGDRIRDAQA